MWREAHFEIKNTKKLIGTEHFWTFRCVLGFYNISKSDGSYGIFERIFKDIFRVAGVIQKIYPSEILGDQGADFLKGVIFWNFRSSDLLK
jgi:hypothetical protein